MTSHGPTPHRLLLTGALGQLGRSVQRALYGRVPMTLLDREGVPSDAADVVRWDLTRELDAATRDRLADCSHVLHLAGTRRDAPASAESVAASIEEHVAVTVNLLRALPASVERLLFVSTISAYGPQPRYPVAESAVPAPVSVYGVAKAYAEDAVRLWNRSRKVSVTIVRLTQVYGPGTDPQNGLYRMLRAALQGQPITLDCRPDMLRDYLHVDDAGRLLAEALLAQAPALLNVGSGAPITMQSFAELVARLCGAPAPKITPGPGGHDLALDTTALSRLGLAPRVALADGVAREVARLRETAGA